MELSDLKSVLDEQLLAMEDRANSRALQVLYCCNLRQHLQSVRALCEAGGIRQALRTPGVEGGE